MPELPEAEVVVRQLRDRIVGARLKGWWIGRPDIIRRGLESIDWYKDATIVGVDRCGKSVAIAFAQDVGRRYLIAELGMTGLLFFRSPDDRYQKHTHLVLTLDGGREPELRYWNPRRFGRVYLLDHDEKHRFQVRRFGHDPLAMTWEGFRQLVEARRGRLKALLMHQQVIAGIGNIYANEILYRARLHPHRRASRLRTRTVERLFQAMRAVLIDAIGNGGSSIRDFMAPDGSRGRYQASHLVYARDGRPCPAACGATIRRLRGERSSFYCPTCQRKT